MSQAKKPKILISAYACEPGKGSEPEVGWQWALHLSEHCDVTVLTRSNNRQSIEEKLATCSESVPRFVYIDLGDAAKKAKKAIWPKFLGMAWYYSAWQKKAFWKIKELESQNDYDLVHHLTFASFRLPFGVTGHNAPSVIGPVGGCEEFPDELLPERGWQIKGKEIFRNVITRASTGLGIGMRRFHYADRVIASTLEMQRVFQEHGIKSVLMSQIGVSRLDANQAPVERVINDELKLLFVGGVLYWKGLELAIQALSILPRHVSLTIIGNGTDEGHLKKEINRLNLVDRVHFLGRKPHSEVVNLYRSYDLFLYPSLHDSGSFTVLEAMAANLPVICLDRGGPAMSVDESCGKIVKSQSRTKTIKALSDAVVYYLENPQKINVHGINAEKRLLELYDWSRKAAAMAAIYDEVIGAASKDR